MGLFGRRRRGEDADDAGDSGDRDPAVPFLTRADAAEVRRLAQRAFAEAGVDVVIHADRFEATDGRAFGLWNLAATCRNAERGRREWPDIVARHVRALLAPTPSPDALSAEEILARTVVRVYGADSVPVHTGWFSYVRPIADDLLEALVLDLPESVLMLRDQDVERVGIEALRHAGLERLLREPVDAIESVRAARGATFQVVLGDSVYTASRILAMRDLLIRVYGEREYPDGVLVAVAHRHQVALHPLDGPGAVDAINAMVAFAKAGFDEGAGGVSPNLYWWHDGALTRLSRVDDDGSIAVEVGPDLAGVLSRLTGG